MGSLRGIFEPPLGQKLPKTVYRNLIDPRGSPHPSRHRGRGCGSRRAGRIFQTIGDVRNAVRVFVARYNAEWLIKKNGHRSPADMRTAWHGQTFRQAA